MPQGVEFGENERINLQAEKQDVLSGKTKICTFYQAGQRNYKCKIEEGSEFKVYLKQKV